MVSLDRGKVSFLNRFDDSPMKQCGLHSVDGQSLDVPHRRRLTIRFPRCCIDASGDGKRIPAVRANRGKKGMLAPRVAETRMERERR